MGQRKVIKVELSWQARKMLDDLVSLGLYGLTAGEVAGRFIDRELIRLADLGHVHIPRKEKRTSK